MTERHGITYVWKSGVWSFAAPSELANVTPSAVACSGAARCVLVGTGATHLPVVDLLTDQGWMAPTYPTIPAIMNAGFLADVSCGTSGVCFAVGGSTRVVATGRFYEFKLNRMLVVRISGSTVAAVAGPVNSGGAALESVDCLGASACVATGTTEPFQQFAATPTPLLARWDGVRWSRTAAEVPADLSSATASVTLLGCFSGGGCEGVDGAAVLSLTGMAWSHQPLPPVQPSGYTPLLSDGSCPSATSCYAVGLAYSTSGSGDGQVGLIEHWNGLKWIHEPVTS